jgi:hypothetical protein
MERALCWSKLNVNHAHLEAYSSGYHRDAKINVYNVYKNKIFCFLQNISLFFIISFDFTKEIFQKTKT